MDSKNVNHVNHVNHIKPRTDKAKIPKALREQVWEKHCPGKHHHKCWVQWCQNTMNVWDFEVGHNIPESLGGTTTIDNLIPICSRCNKGMGNRMTIEEWSKTYAKPTKSSQSSDPLAMTSCFGCTCM